MNDFCDPRVEIEEQLRVIMPTAERFEVGEVKISREGTAFDFAVKFTDGSWLNAENVSYSSEENVRLRRALFSWPPVETQCEGP